MINQTLSRLTVPPSFCPVSRSSKIRQQEKSQHHRSKLTESQVFFHFVVFLFYSVDEGLHVKLTDCALARDLFPSDYHCLGDNENRPIKWLALESLTHKVFTPAADVVGVGLI